MAKESYSQILALMTIAREGSFTRAAGQLGISQSMLSYIVRRMEEETGVRLLTRTTRSVSLTEAGVRLLERVGPRLESISEQLHSLVGQGGAPGGTVRITASDHAIDTVLCPKLMPLLRDNPRLKIEMHSDYALTDIVQGGFDFGVRLGEDLTKSVTAFRIAPDMRLAIVGAPAYLQSQPLPESPRELVGHRCINLRMPTSGNLYAWELAHGSQTLEVRVDGQLTFNGIYQVLSAAVAGQGLAYVPEDLAAPYFESGRLRPVLEGWWKTFPGYHLYYARQRKPSLVMSQVIQALRSSA